MILFDQNSRHRLTVPDESRSIENSDVQFAGPLRRLYAFAIDVGILLMAIFVVGPIFGSNEGIFNISNIQTGIIDVFIFLAYFIVPTGIFGADYRQVGGRHLGC